MTLSLCINEFRERESERENYYFLIRWEVPDLLRLLSEKTTPTPINNSSSSSSLSLLSLLPVTPQHVPPLPSSLEEERGGSPFCPTSQVEDKGCSPTSIDPVPSPPLSPLLFSGVSPVEKEINFDASHDYHVTSPTPPAPVPIKAPSSPHHFSVATGDTPSGCGKRVEFITPYGVARGGALLQSDDNITPMPDYKNMATPHLKVNKDTSTCSSCTVCIAIINVCCCELYYCLKN